MQIAAPKNAWQDNSFVHAGAGVPTVRYGFDKEHPEVWLQSFKFHSKELKRIVHQGRLDPKRGESFTH